MGTTILGVVLAALKPLWIWGTVVSAATMVPASGLVLGNINRKDPEFKEYLKNRGPVKNTLHFLKSAAKIFIPIYNVVHPFKTIGRLVNLGVTGLKDKWKDKIENVDEALDNVKKIGTGTKKIAVGLVNKIKNRKTQSVQKTVENVNKPQVVAKTNTKPAKPVVQVQPKTSVPTRTASPVKTATQPQVTKPAVAKKKSAYELLTEKLDAINASDYETSQILKYYSQQYWAARKRYDALLEAGMDTTEEMDRILLFYNKCQEFEQMRGITQKPAQPVLK